MSDVLSISKDHSLSSIESWLARLESSGPIDLLLNTSVRHAQFGGLNALNQLIVTWAKRNQEASLRTYVNHAHEIVPQIKGLATYDHGLTALLMARRVSNRAGDQDLSRQAIEATRARLGSMATLEAARRGTKAFLAVADHTGIYPPTLYNSAVGREPEVRQWTGFKILTRQLLEIVMTGPEAGRPTSAAVEGLATVLFELFKNTHDWARHSPDWLALPRSVRGIRVEHYSHAHDKHLEMTSDEPMLSNYLSHPGMKRAGGRSRMIEVSVFDSGPGLAARALQRSASETSGFGDSIAVEHSAVIDCLRTHFSTSTDTYRGNGLHQVLLMLTSLHGFLRIRTGRLALYRDLLAAPYTPTNSAEPFLLDWQTGSEIASPAPPVEGLALTMLFPAAYD